MSSSCSFYLKYLFTADLDATVAGLGLLLGQLLPQDLQLLHQVPLVLGHRQALGLLGQLGGGQRLLGDAGTTLVLQRRRMTEGTIRFKGRRRMSSRGEMEESRRTDEV